MLAASPWQVCSLDDIGFDGDVDEPHDTYLDNATRKATVVCAATAMVTLADDSGIEIPGLDGFPGPKSARWMGPDASDADRRAGLLAMVRERCPDAPQARYVAAVVVARPGADPVVAEGVTTGRLIEPRGGGGFGYDPSFLSDDLGITFAEADQDDKDRVSHRGRALRRLMVLGALDSPAAQP